MTYPEFEPALVEKMKIQLALQDWEQTMDVAQRFSDVFIYFTMHAQTSSLMHFLKLQFVKVKPLSKLTNNKYTVLFSFLASKHDLTIF